VLPKKNRTSRITTKELGKGNAKKESSRTKTQEGSSGSEVAEKKAGYSRGGDSAGVRRSSAKNIRIVCLDRMKYGNI